MLKLTRKTEYALIALKHMKQKADRKITTTKEIADSYNIPYEILAKTLQHLARTEIVEAIHGAHGGYRVKADLDKLTLTELFEILEGPIGLVDCHLNIDCGRIETCDVKAPIRQINKSVRDLLNKLTVQDVVGQ